MITDSDPPFYFRRVWAGSTPMDEVTLFTRQPDGTLVVTVGIPAADVPVEIRESAIQMPDLQSDGLVIYGRALGSDDQHDRDYAAQMKARGQVWSECFSVACVGGELGTHPLAAITEITREEFLAAKERGWDDG
jgi:hypothetical protein